MKKNNGLSSTITKILGYIFSVLVILFSSYNTFQLLHTSSGNLIIAVLGLVLFEGGMVYWWLVFQNGAEGLPQMGIALLVFALCLLGVVIASGVELGAVQLSLDSHLPQQLTVGALVVQLIAKMVYPLVSPETSRRIKTKILEGQLISKAETKLDGKMAELADDIAEKMSENAKDNLLLSIGHTSGKQTIRPLQVGSAVVTKSADAEVIEGSEGDNFLE